MLLRLGRAGVAHGLNGPVSAVPTPSEIPFEHDAQTYWIDFISASNATETTGYTSTAAAIEQIAGVANLVQPTKDFQPLVQTDGVNFNKDTARQMQVENPSGITNGSDGWYIALNCRVDTSDSNILSIARNANNVASRGQIYVPSNRQFGFKAADNDGGAPNWIARGPAITLGQWYTLEMQWDLASDTVTIWYDGVVQTNAISTVALAMSAFPATDPSEMTVGNWSASDIDSFDGEIQNLIFHDGVPSTAIRSSISTYLTGVRP